MLYRFNFFCFCFLLNINISCSTKIFHFSECLNDLGKNDWLPSLRGPAKITKRWKRHTRTYENQHEWEQHMSWKSQYCYVINAGNHTMEKPYKLQQYTLLYFINQHKGFVSSYFQMINHNGPRATSVQHWLPWKCMFVSVNSKILQTPINRKTSIKAILNWGFVM